MWLLISPEMDLVIQASLPDPGEIYSGIIKTHCSGKLNKELILKAELYWWLETIIKKQSEWFWVCGPKMSLTVGPGRPVSPLSPGRPGSPRSPCKRKFSCINHNAETQKCNKWLNYLYHSGQYVVVTDTLGKKKGLLSEIMASPSTQLHALDREMW